MGQTVAQKIVARAAGRPAVEAGEYVNVSPDYTCCQELSGRPCASQRYRIRVLYFRGLLAIIPPGFGDTATIARLRRRLAESVPIGEPMRALVPVRDPIAAVADNAIEHFAGGHQRRTTIGSDDLLNQQINKRVGDASENSAILSKRRIETKKRSAARHLEEWRSRTAAR